VTTDGEKMSQKQCEKQALVQGHKIIQYAPGDTENSGACVTVDNCEMQSDPQTKWRLFTAVKAWYGQIPAFKLADSTLLDFASTQPFTISARVKRLDRTSSVTIISKMHRNKGYSIGLLPGEHDGRILVTLAGNYVGKDVMQVVSSRALEVDVWTEVTVVNMGGSKQAENIRIFVNGHEDVTRPTPPANNLHAPIENTAHFQVGSAGCNIADVIVSIGIAEPPPTPTKDWIEYKGISNLEDRVRPGESAPCCQYMGMTDSFRKCENMVLAAQPQMGDVMTWVAPRLDTVDPFEKMCYKLNDRWFGKPKPGYMSAKYKMEKWLDPQMPFVATDSAPFTFTADQPFSIFADIYPTAKQDSSIVSKMEVRPPHTGIDLHISWPELWRTGISTQEMGQIFIFFVGEWQGSSGGSRKAKVLKSMPIIPLNAWTKVVLLCNGRLEVKLFINGTMQEPGTQLKTIMPTDDMPDSQKLSPEDYIQSLAPLAIGQRQIQSAEGTPDKPGKTFIGTMRNVTIITDIVKYPPTDVSEEIETELPTPPPTVTTTTTTFLITLASPIAVGASHLTVTKIAGINIGDEITVSSDGLSETNTVIGIQASLVQSNSLRGEGTLEVRKKFTQPFPSGARVVVSMPLEDELPTAPTPAKAPTPAAPAPTPAKAPTPAIAPALAQDAPPAPVLKATPTADLKESEIKAKVEEKWNAVENVDDPKAEAGKTSVKEKTEEAGKSQSGAKPKKQKTQEERSMKASSLKAALPKGDVASDHLAAEEAEEASQTYVDSLLRSLNKPSHQTFVESKGKAGSVINKAHKEKKADTKQKKQEDDLLNFEFGVPGLDVELPSFDEDSDASIMAALTGDDSSSQLDGMNRKENTKELDSLSDEADRELENSLKEFDAGNQ
jgi:hypothetical protein